MKMWRSALFNCRHYDEYRLCLGERQARTLSLSASHSSIRHPTDMRPIVLALLFKLLSLVGATLNTVGFLSFFFWPTLQPYRWHLIVSGVIIMVVAEFAGRRISNRPTDDGDSA